MRIAVTGGIGSGKSVVCRRLAEKGLMVVISDELSKKAVSPGTEAYAKIVAYFGGEILLPDNTLDRRKLRRIISTDIQAKKVLEGFIHPEVFRQMEKQADAAAENGEPFVVVEVPLLFESGLDTWFDWIVMVDGDEERRIRRIMARDGISREEVLAMMNIQMADNEKRRRADYCVENNASEEDLLHSVDRMYEHMMAQMQSAGKKNDNS